MTEEQIKELARIENQKHCDPPLDEKEFEKQWHDAKNYIAKNKTPNKTSMEQKTTENQNLDAELLKTVRERYINIYKDQFNNFYLTLKINNHIECVPLNSIKFKSVIRAEYYNTHNNIISDEKLDSIISLMESQLMFDEEIQRIELNLRVAKMDDGSIYYDLTNSKWEIIKIISKDWDVIQNNTLPLFKRFDNSSVPQVYPTHNYPPNIFEKFLDLFNLGSNNDRLLLSVYIIALLIPSISKPILILNGQGGGAKTTTFNIIKRVIDPSSTDTISFPNQINDLIQTLDHNYINYFDNVSKIKDETSDLLCKAVTGAGFTKRALYTNDSDIIYKFKRCIGVNGINLATTRPDFLDRSIIIKVKRIEDNKRKKEAEIEKNLDNLKSQLLGFIFDILSKTLKHKKEIPDENILNNRFPRMADFAEWGERISRCLGYPDNSFIRAYYENINNQNDEVIESSEVAEAIISFVKNRVKGYQWTGTPTRLLKELNDMMDQIKPDVRRSNSWPKMSSSLTPLINEVIPNLKLKGIEVITGEKDHNGDRMIIITRLTSNNSEGSFAEQLTQGINNTKNYHDKIQSEFSDFNPNIHRIGNSDKWACDVCSLYGDIHFLKTHDCREKGKDNQSI